MKSAAIIYTLYMCLNILGDQHHSFCKCRDRDLPSSLHLENMHRPTHNSSIICGNNVLQLLQNQFTTYTAQTPGIVQVPHETVLYSLHDRMFLSACCQLHIKQGKLPYVVFLVLQHQYSYSYL